MTPVETPPVIVRGVFKYNEPMAKHTSWRAGGVADRVFVPADIEDLRHLLESEPGGMPVSFLGLGSNLLVRDGGYRGTLVLTHAALKQICVEPTASGVPAIYAEAGVAAPKLARFAARHGLVGAEFLAGIPGTVGGALAMNAGCYGAETWETVAQVLVIERGGAFVWREPGDFEIGYRHVQARFPAYQGFAAARFLFRAGDGAQSQQTIKNLLQRRIASQPLNLPNAGSVFRNPPNDFAARLIERSGLKGFRIGGAEVSTKHANFIVNVGQATARDIESVIDTVQREVQQRFGIDLIREVRIIGEERAP